MAPNEDIIPSCEDKMCDEDKIIQDKVHITKLPSFSELNVKVQKIVKSSSTWDLYGVDLFKLLSSVSLVPVCLMVLKNGEVMSSIVATVILGAVHTVVTHQYGHCSTHGSIIKLSPAFVKLTNRILLEFFGSYSAYMASLTHIDIHHPYTNIIGLGDSSTWKAPFLGREVYLFVMPLFLPAITPFIALKQLLFEEGNIKESLKFIAVCIAGYATHVWVFTHYVGYSVTWAIAYILLYRSLFQIPYIHLNIFQHIGLPMYSPKHRPTSRVYLMSRGVLNLSRNVLLDYVFGHSLINCHVEHHLFPRLSDNMCLKIKPVVMSYLKEHGLRYNEDGYMNRLRDFYDRYEELMVHAPPITHFVGVQ